MQNSNQQLHKRNWKQIFLNDIWIFEKKKSEKIARNHYRLHKTNKISIRANIIHGNANAKLQWQSSRAEEHQHTTVQRTHGIWLWTSLLCVFLSCQFILQCRYFSHFVIIHNVWDWCKAKKLRIFHSPYVRVHMASVLWCIPNRTELESKNNMSNEKNSLSWNWSGWDKTH